MKIPFKSKLTRFTNIANRNKAFHKLTKRQKRMEIAYDSLLLLLTKKTKATQGDYWGWELNKRTMRCKTPEALQELLTDKLPRTCEVCARGSMMVSQIRLGNNVHPNTPDLEMGCADIVEGFTMTDFHLMERQFEYHAFNPMFPNPNENLANICCNVIKNGNFNPKDDTDYLTKWGINL